MEMRISRDGLDHILDAVQTQTPVGAGRDLPKVRTTSQMRPYAPDQRCLPARSIPLVSRLRPHVYMIEAQKNDRFDTIELRYAGP